MFSDTKFKKKMDLIQGDYQEKFTTGFADVLSGIVLLKPGYSVY